MSRFLSRPMLRPRLGFLGLGWIGRHRMKAIHESGLAHVVAVADPSASAAEASREVVPSCEVVPNLDALLAADLDGIVIATPSALHAQQTIQALRRGLAVFCQKPLARTLSETRAVLDAARHANRLLAVDLSYRFTEAMRALFQKVQTRVLGDVYAVNLVFHNAYGPDKAWFYDPALSGGGCLMDLGTHLVDLALWTLDFPEVKQVTSRLLAGGKPVHGRKRVEDYAVAQLTLDSGAVIQLACSWKLPAGCDALIEASFYGTQAGARFENIGGSFYDFKATLFRKTSKTVLCSPPDDWGGRAAVDFASRLAQSPAFDPQAESLARTAEVIDRLYEAA